MPHVTPSLQHCTGQYGKKSYEAIRNEQNG